MRLDTVIAYVPPDAGILVCPDCAKQEYSQTELDDMGVDFYGTEVDYPPTCDLCLETIDGYTILHEEEEVPCPMCGYTNTPMGTLGRVIHYSCRACGMGYSLG